MVNRLPVIGGEAGVQEKLLRRRRKIAGADCKASNLRSMLWQ